MALNKAQCGQIRSLMKDDRWDAIIKFLAQKIETLRAERIAGTNAFEELRALHTRDAKVDGLIEFFDQLEKQAFNE